MKSNLLFLLPLALLLTACPPQDAPSGCVKADLVNQSPNQKDDFTINSASVTGDEVTLSVSYGGGCAPEKVEFSADLRLLPTLGVLPIYELTVLLKDDDNCEALITADICIGISAEEKPAGTKGFLTIIGPADTLDLDWE